MTGRLCSDVPGRGRLARLGPGGGLQLRWLCRLRPWGPGVMPQARRIWGVMFRATEVRAEADMACSPGPGSQTLSPSPYREGGCMPREGRGHGSPKEMEKSPCVRSHRRAPRAGYPCWAIFLAIPEGLGGPPRPIGWRTWDFCEHLVPARIAHGLQLPSKGWVAIRTPRSPQRRWPRLPGGAPLS